MSRRFVLIDRDGTINEERHYLSLPEQLALLPGVAAGLKSLQGLGLGLAVVTNQSGIGRGYFDQAALERVHQRLIALLRAEGVTLDGIYSCPHGPDEDCDCRKPRPGMIAQAAREHGFDPAQAFVIGDKGVDMDLGRAVGAVTLLVRTGYGRRWEGKAAADYVVDDLEAAAKVIAGLV